MTDAETEKRFEGAGQEFHAKYMGSVEVAKSKGQEVCQEAMQKLLVTLKTRKEPKPRLIVNLSYDGTHLKEMPPGINLLDITFKHNHVSYVWKDPRDQRSLGIVCTEVDPEDSSKVTHKFHGIRTIKPAMPFLQEMQELFRIVKERSAQHKERAASVAATAAATAAAAPAPADGAAAAEAATPVAAAADLRDRAVSNLLGDLPDTAGPGLPKNASVASLDDLGDIFSASTTIGQQPQPTLTSQPMVGGPFGQPSGPFGQPSGPFGQPSGPFGQPSSPFGQPSSPFGQPSGPFGQPIAGGGAFGQPMGGNPYGQPMTGGAFGQPIGGGGAFAQPMPGGQFRPGAPTNPFGQQQPQPQPMVGAGYGAYGQHSPMPYGQQQPQQPPQQNYQQQYSYQQPRQPVSTNPFDSGFSSVFDRQNSTPSGAQDLLTPVALSPLPMNSGAPAAKPDAFGDLVVGLTTTADPKRQQVSGKDLFKPTDKPKATLRDMANQSPRP